MVELKSSIRNIPISHVATLLTTLLVALLLHRIDHTAPSRESGVSLGRQIADTYNLAVLPDSVVWLTGRPSTTLKDALRWHTLVFLAKENEKKPADFYRLDVRAVSSDAAFASKNLINLSNSPAGDEYDIAVAGQLAAVKNRVLGQVRSVTIYDFRFAPKIAGESSPFTRFLSRITNYLEQGQIRGIGKTVIRFSAAPKAVALNFRDDFKLDMVWKDMTGKPHNIGVIPGDDSGDAKEITVTTTVKLEKRPVLWMVDTIRSFSFIGPGPIEWLEGRFFALQDLFKRAHYQLVGDAPRLSASEVSEIATETLDLPKGIEIGPNIVAEVWPPPSFDPPIFKRKIPGEGIWQPAAPKFIRTLPNAPTAFFRTITRPDISRPYVKVELIAMDMRQLSLHMVGGHEDPQSTTGSSGTGRLPRKAEILTRTVAAFNGAFKTEHGAYGMMVEKNVLLPPKDDSATVAAMADETTLMGSWPKKMPIPEAMRSYRQNMDPLIENGVVNPRRRYLWGFTLDEDITKMHTIRSGICISDKGYMVYGWGEDLTATTLGKAMIAAGCTYGLHLDMNPFHTSFIYYRFEDCDDGERPEYQSKLALPEMRYSPHRYVNGAPKDFFFLTLKDPRPGPDWSSEGFAQPYPASVPAVFKKKTGTCILLAVDLSRGFAFLDPGEFPDYLTPGKLPTVSKERETDLLVDIALGPWSSVRGQMANHSVIAALKPSAGTLGVGSNGELTLAPWPILPTFKQAIQGHWLDGTSTEVQIAMARREKWLFVGIGPQASLKKALSDLGADQPVGFSATSFHPTKHDISVRTKQGMMDLDERPVTQTDASQAHLRIFATPRFLGAKRLETLAPATTDNPNEAEETEHEK